MPFFISRLRRLENTTMGVNYGLNRVRFPSPLPVGTRVRGRITFVAAEAIDSSAARVVTCVVIEAEGGGKPTCVADMVSRHYFQAADERLGSGLATRKG